MVQGVRATVKAVAGLAPDRHPPGDEDAEPPPSWCPRDASPDARLASGRSEAVRAQGDQGTGCRVMRRNDPKRPRTRLTITSAVERR